MNRHDRRAARHSEAVARQRKAASDDDWAFFDRFPNRSYRIRRPLPSEVEDNMQAVDVLNAFLSDRDIYVLTHCIRPNRILKRFVTAAADKHVDAEETLAFAMWQEYDVRELKAASCGALH